MFYDERIELERGRISRNCIALCVLLSLISCILQGYHIFLHRPQLWVYIGVELVTVLTGLIILTLGLLRSRGSDERAISTMHLFYNKAMFVFLMIVGAAMAILFPISLLTDRPSNFASDGFGRIVELLLFSVGIYAIYSFKKRDIYFNYSIMESDHYCLGIMKNIGKAWLYILCAFGLSVATLGLLWILDPNSFLEDVSVLLTVYIGYALLFAVCTGLYFLFSFLERESYQKETGISHAAGICLIVTVCVYCVYAFAVLWLNRQVIDQEYEIRLLNYVQMLFPYIQFALMLFLVYFSYEYTRRYGASAVGLGSLCILLGLVGTTCANYFLRLVQYALINLDPLNQDWMLPFSYLRQICEGVKTLSYMAGLCMILHTLIKNGLLSKAHYALYAAFALFVGIDLFLWAQAEYMLRTNFLAGIYAAVLIYLCFVVFTIIRKSAPKEGLSHE